MSLDVYLRARRPEVPCVNCAGTGMIPDIETHYETNITHNLAEMASAAGIYMYLWRPDEIGITHARQLIEPLTAGLALLRSDPERFKAFDSPNGWGSYEHFVPFVAKYLNACREHPDAEVEVSR